MEEKRDKAAESFKQEYDEMEERIDDALECLGREYDEPCEELICDEGVESPRFARAALDAGIFYPNFLYQNADADTRDRLISLLEDYGTEDVFGALTALAAIGDETTAECFVKWEEHPRLWMKKLASHPMHYAKAGGWVVEQGERRQLYFDRCYALEKAEDKNLEENVFGGVCEDSCPSCGSRFVNELVIDGGDERLAFLGIPGKIKIKYCAACVTEMDYSFCRWQEDGESEFIGWEFAGKPWSPKVPPDGSGTVCADVWSKHSRFVLSQKPVSMNYCKRDERSAIGGRPCFLNHPNTHYAKCPQCGKTMTHLAQLDAAYCSLGVGVEYVQICKPCKTAAVSFMDT